MTDLVQDPVASAAQSPRRKFSFKFPLGHATIGGSGSHMTQSLDGGSGGGVGGGEAVTTTTNKFGASGRHFSDELKNVTDIQVSSGADLLQI